MKDHGLSAFLVCFITLATLTIYAFCLAGSFLYPPSSGAAASEFYATKVHGADGGNSLVAETGGQIDCATDTLYLQDKQIVIGRYSGDPSSATVTVTLSGVDSNDWLTASLNTRTAAAHYLVSAVPHSGTVEVVLNDDPGESVNITVLGFKD